MESIAAAVERDGSTVRPAAAELLPIAHEGIVVASTEEPILSPEPPVEASPAVSDQEARIVSAVSLPGTEPTRDRIEEVAQLSPARSAEEVLPSSEPPAAGTAAQTLMESPVPASVLGTSANQADGSLGRELWQLTKENPTQALGAFFRLLEVGHMKNDQSLVERAHCGLALVYALQGDGPHAAERLQRARMAASKRGNTSEVEEVAQRVDELISARIPRR
jgi:hypothetical protein